MHNTEMSQILKITLNALNNEWKFSNKYDRKVNTDNDLYLIKVHLYQN